jgi:MoxR-like ATPase
VKLQKLVAAAAVLAGRTVPTEADLWPIVTAVPLAEQQSIARESLAEVLAQTENRALLAASEEASLGVKARAARVLAAARTLLDAKPDDHAELDRWKLRIEGIAREIDASFGREHLSAELQQVRETVRSILSAA